MTTAEVAWAHLEVCYEYCVAGTTYTGKYEMNLSPFAPIRTGAGVAELNAEAKQYMRIDQRIELVGRAGQSSNFKKHLAGWPLS